jgi:drug/metabolite transporter (DMT)-like permease
VSAGDRLATLRESPAGVRGLIERRPTAALPVAVAAVSTAAILVRASAAPELVQALYRLLFTTALVAPVAVARHREELRALAASRRDLAVAALTGVALAVHFLSWFLSLDRTSVAASVTLVQAQPVFVAVGAHLLLDERVDRRTVAGIAVALAGAGAMALADPGASVPLAGQALVGNGLALVGAATLAAYLLVGRSLRQRVSLFPYVTVVYAAATLALLVAAVAAGVPLLGYPGREWLLFAGLAVGPGLFGHTVLNWALAAVDSSLVSVTLLGEPVGSTLLAVAVLGEVPTPGTVVGGLAVLAGVVVVARRRADDARAGTGDSTRG